MTPSRLSVDQLRFYYKEDAWRLQVDTLPLESGQFLGIVGPNGSGKSTLLRLLAGVLTPVSGAVELNDTVITDIPRRCVARDLGYLPQDTPALYDVHVHEVVAMGRYAHSRALGVLGPSDRAAIQQATDTLGVTDFAMRPLSHLSGGERRRVMIASVLAQQPGILLLDEPTSGLDLHHATSIMRRLAGLAGDGLAVAVVTHDLNLASLFCSHLLVMHKGQAHISGPPADVLNAQLLKELYSDEVLIHPHPTAHRPMVLPSTEASP